VASRRWRTGSRLDLRFGALLTAAIALAGCASSHYGSTLRSDQVAVLDADHGTLIEGVDGVSQSRGQIEEPVTLVPGPHTVRLRRRIEVPLGARSTQTAPLGYPMRVATDPRGTAVYASDSNCEMVFEARGGVQYVARTTGGGDGLPWVGSIAGPGVDVHCTARDAVPDELVGQTRYLCCAMTFEAGETTDANYLFRGSGTGRLPAGTRLTVTGAGLNRIDFRAEPDGATYRVYFEYGTAHTDVDTYLTDILRQQDPTVVLGTLPAPIVEAIAAGRLVPGMTREQALLARGYPPRHRTPDLAAAEWLYYDEPGLGVYVTFADGVIKSLRGGPAP
jgi:hypothetical protein